MAGVSVREAARLFGVSHVTFLKEHKKGSLQFEPDGTVDPEKVANSEWAKSRASRGFKIPKAPEQRQKLSPDPEPPAGEQPKHKADIDRLSSVNKIDLDKLLVIERRESLRLNNEERRGSLLKASEVEATWAQVIIMIRDRLLSLPGRAAGRLVSINDPAEVRRILEREVREILSNLEHSKINEVA